MYSYNSVLTTDAPYLYFYYFKSDLSDIFINLVLISLAVLISARCAGMRKAPLSSSCPSFHVQIYPAAVELMQVIEEFIHIVGLGMKDFHNAYLMTGNLGETTSHFAIYLVLTGTHNPSSWPSVQVKLTSFYFNAVYLYSAQQTSSQCTVQKHPHT